MKSKFLKCLSTGITAAVLAASIIPISASTAFAAADSSFKDYYEQYNLPDHNNDGQGETYYSIYQIASLETYDRDTGFAVYKLNDAFKTDENSKRLFDIDANGRIVYYTTANQDDAKLFDISYFGGDSTNNYGTDINKINRDLLTIVDRAAEVAKLGTGKVGDSGDLVYNGEVQGGKHYVDGTGEEDNPKTWDTRDMFWLGHGSQVKLKNGLYIMTSTGSKIQAPNLIVADNYTELTPTKFTDLVDKGSNITIDKTITNVSGDTADNQQNAVDGYWGKATTDGESAEVRIGSTVSFMLDSMIPMYDDRVKAVINGDSSTGATLSMPTDYNGSDTGIIDYIILDDPSPCLDIQFDETNTKGLKIYVANKDNEGKPASKVADDGWIEINESNLSSLNDSSYTANSVADVLKVDKVQLTDTNLTNDFPFVNENSNHKDHNYAGNGFAITFTDKFVVNHQNRAVKVEFDAKINDQGKMSTLGGSIHGVEMPNEGIVQYDNNFIDGARTASVNSHTVYLYRAQINIHKVDGSNANLENFEFTIYDNSGKKVTDSLKTNSSGVLTFNELPAGTYTIKETPHEGYKQIPDITFTIAANKNVGSEYNGIYTLTVDSPSTATFINDTTIDSGIANTLKIVNYKAQTLPGTGGMGTVIFTVVGAGIIVLAGVLFVVYMKKRRVEEK